VAAPSADPTVSACRAEIDAADRALLAALNQRIEAVRRLHDYKAGHGVPLSDPAREEALVAALVAANAGPLADASVPALVREVLAITRREVERLRG
jgi:chorismate mutase